MNAGEKNSGKSSKAKYRFRRLCFFLIIILLIWWFNNFTLKTTKAEIRSDKISSPVRIAVISDLHAFPLGISNKRIVRRISRAEPDIVAVLGDMYTTGSSRDRVDIAVDLIRDITDEGYPVYLVTGEHDRDKDYIDAVEEAGADVMNYREEIVELNGNRLQIMGIDNVYYSDTFDLTSEFTLREDCFSLLLAHIPSKKLTSFKADLTLCADTHGDMVQLPFDLGPVYSPSYDCPFPQIFLGKEIYDKGMFPYDGGNMFITSGIGVSPLPIRFNNRPEIVVIDVVPE